MPKVPTLDGPRVGERPLQPQYNNVNTNTGGQAVVEGLGQVRQGISALEVARQHAAERADAVAVQDKVTQFEHRATTRLRGDSSGQAMKTGEMVPGQWGLDLSKPTPEPQPGFLSLKGVAAGEHSADLLDGLDKDRQELAQSLANDRQRQLFAQHASKMYEGYRAQVETHVSTQRRAAEEASLEAAAAVGLNSIAANFADDSQVEATAKRVESAVRAFALSPEDAEAKAQAWQAQVAATRLDQFIAAKNWSKAEEVFSQSKEALGPKGKQYAAAISTLKQDMEGERVAARLVDIARDPANGRVDMAKALEALDVMPPGPQKDETRQRLEHRLSIEERNWKQRVDKVFDRSLGSYLTSGTLSSISSADKAWLIQNDPESWDKLKQRAMRDAEHRHMLGQRAKAESEKETDEERQALVELRADVASNPDKYLTMSQDAFNAEWWGRLSNEGYKTAGALFAATKTEQKGSSTEWSHFLEDEVRSNPALSNKKKSDLWKSFMGDQRRSFIEQHKREPNFDEMEKMREASYAEVTKKGLLWDSKQPAFTQEKPKPGDIPAADRSQIEDALKRAKKPVNEQNIRLMWNISQTRKDLKQ